MLQTTTVLSSKTIVKAIEKEKNNSKTTVIVKKRTKAKSIEK